MIDDRAETDQLHPAMQDVDCTDEQNRFLHKTIKAVTQDFRSMSFNTAIARMMEFVNFFNKQSNRPRKAMEQFVDALDGEPDRIAVHPAFGDLTLRKWAKLHGKHFDHHLRQFGA